MPTEYLDCLVFNKETVRKAVEYAQEKTLEEFPDNVIACRLCGQYIEDAFDFFVKSIRE